MTQVLHTAVKAGIPDCMGDKAWRAADLAVVLAFNADALERFLRMMVVLDLLVQVGTEQFCLSEAGMLLRGDHPESMRDRVLYIGAINYPVAGAALHSLKTGETAFEHVFGIPFFDHLSKEPELGRAFNGLMQRGIEGRIAGILGAVNFSRARRIVDLGGGNGTLVASILKAAPEATGTLLDLPAVIKQAREHLAGSDVVSRIDLVEGDLFADPYPDGADIYLLSNIIHDWDDDRAVLILQRCRQAMHPESTLLLIEEVLPSFVSDSPSTVANDYSMLLLTGGHERTHAGYIALLGRCGLELSAVIPFSLGAEDGKRRGNWAVMECHAA